MKKIIILHVIFLILASFAVLATTLQKVEVFNIKDLSILSCGWPLEFMENDQSWRDPLYPWKITCSSALWQGRVTYNLPNFFIDVLIFYVLIIGIVSNGLFFEQFGLTIRDYQDLSRISI